MKAQLANENFLYVSDVFGNSAGEDGKFGDLGDTRIRRIACLLAQGTFGAARQQVIDLFVEVGGYDFSLSPRNLKAVLKLCLDLSIASHRSLSTESFELWYDPFSGRLELSTKTGANDSLSIWSKKAIATTV